MCAANGPAHRGAGWTNWASWITWARFAATGDRSPDYGPPLLCLRGRAYFEGEIGGYREGGPDFAARNVLAFNSELGAVDTSNDGVWEVKGEVRGRFVAVFIVVLETMQVSGWCDNIVPRAEPLERRTGFALD